MNHETAQLEEPDQVTATPKNSLIKFVSNRISQLLTPAKKTEKHETWEDIFENDKDKTTPIDPKEKAILQNVLEFRELHVEDVMIPRADIFALPDDIQFADLQSILSEKIFTRIPVYKSDLDEILGFIHIKDIARAIFENKQFKLNESIRKCLFVPSAMKISNLLIRMQQTRVHIAIVIDEYGGTEGIITLEDIVEKIVGNIEDEHDDEETSHLFKKISDDIFEVNSRMPVDEFSKKSGIDITSPDIDKSFDTIGGLVAYILGRIPVKGEIINFSDLIELEVTDADARSVRRLIVKKKG